MKIIWLFRVREQCYHLPFLEASFLKIEGLPIAKFFETWVNHCDDKEYWLEMGQPLPIEKINVPCLFHSGWYDYMCPGTIKNFMFMSQRKDNPELAASHRLVIGPWIHGTDFGAGAGSSNAGINYGDVSFPANAGWNGTFYNKFLSWYDRWLRDNKEADTGAPVTIYVMGENVWREEQEWPLSRTEYSPLYLDSKGDARTVNGNGLLSFNKPSKKEFDTYKYDPMDPCDNSDNSIFSGKIKDRTDKELRSDMLIYSTKPFENEIEVTGNVVARLYIKSSAVDTDFYVRLVDVQPNGRAYGLLEGVFRMRYRDGWYAPHFMTPGEVYCIDVNLGGTSMVFKKGHSIRIEITSSDFPNNERNLNTADPMGYGSEAVVALQTIMHNEQYPSQIILPVIPR